MSEIQDVPDMSKHQGCKEPCPSSPSPEGYKLPEDPGKDYYNKIPSDKLEPIIAAKNKKYNDALEAKAQSLATADEVNQTAKGAYDVAQKKWNSAKNFLDLQIKNKKVQIREEYRQCLREAVPKNCNFPAGKNVDIEEDDRIPPEKKAICIAQLKQKLANEEVKYLTDLQKINEQWFVAVDTWESAQKKYNSAVCMADSVEKQAKCAANVEFYNAISKALEDICK
jgi:hypothetical protein